MRLFPLAAASLLLCLLGCGGAAPGGSCRQPGFLCADDASALECRDGKWVTLPCRGPNGCVRSGELISCDMSLNQVDDACASSAEGKGICSVDRKATLECRDGALVKTNDCSGCAVSGDQVVCQP